VHVPVLALFSVLLVQLLSFMNLDSDSVVDNSDLPMDHGDDGCVGDMSSLHNVQYFVKQGPFDGIADSHSPNSLQDGLDIVIVIVPTTDVFTVDKLAIESTDVELEGSSTNSEILDMMSVYLFRCLDRSHGGIFGTSDLGYLGLVARFSLDLDVGCDLVVLSTVAIVSTTLGSSCISSNLG
jgi:hypothetical protein